MDAFFVSVELLRRPELRGQPVVVGGSGNRGVVAAASYEARSHGIFSAMPSTRAKRLCPHAIFLPGDHALYGEVSRRVMAIFRSYTPLIEPLSLDEAFLDVSGALRLFGDGPTIGARIRDEIHEQEQLWCSVGVARSKFLAKLASEKAKPKISAAGPVNGTGVRVVEAGRELDFLHPLPIRDLWGVGPATFARLDRIGVQTVGDLAALPIATVTGALGEASGRHLHNLAHAIDERDVETDGQTKSISHEETFALDRPDAEHLHSDLVRMADAVAARLRRADLEARTVTIKVRFPDFETLTRRITLDRPTDSGIEIAREAKQLLAKLDLGRGVRLFGVGTSQLQPAGVRQMTFDDAEAPRWTEADAAVDSIRERFGDQAIGPGVRRRPEPGKKR